MTGSNVFHDLCAWVDLGSYLLLEAVLVNTVRKNK